MSAKETALGFSRTKWMFKLFQGEYDADGNLKNPKIRISTGSFPSLPETHDFLPEGCRTDTKDALHQDADILDCMEIHMPAPDLAVGRAVGGLAELPYRNEVPKVPEPQGMPEPLGS